MHFITAIFVLAISNLVSSSEVELPGKCPKVPFVESFDMSKFAGTWYGIKETGDEVPCAHYELTEHRANHIHATLQPLNLTIELDKHNVNDYADGLDVTFKVNPIMDGSHLSIFATDYGELK